MDNWLIDIMKDNIITVWAILEVLRGIAYLTPTVKDDKVITMIQNIYWSIRERKVEKARDRFEPFSQSPSEPRAEN